MEIIYYTLTAFILITSILSFIDHPHWMFRVFEFTKVHLVILQFATFMLALIFMKATPFIWGIQAFLVLLMVYNASILVKYTSLYKVVPQEKSPKHSAPVTLLSANVYQFNKNYQPFIDLVHQTKPNIVLTIESNKDWDKALEVLEKDYPNHKKVPLENTYGLHFYTNLKIKKVDVHWFVADDIPSIEAQLQTDDGYNFTFFGVHPPPPSPTEEENSKERDGELMCVAKKVRDGNAATVVVGDFNTVAWSKASTLFRKTAELVDPRIGRGLISTFHANYRWFRFPIDQMFHTPDIYVNEFTVLDKFGSDHLPLFAELQINNGKNLNQENVESLEEGEMEEVDELIAEGKAEDGERDAVAKE
ncbi:endonuclease/exonuclease/phosphatase family protein [Owenweeksia hongkongensis]|uniref:endonuclease/exonuclease/phosphatase family protein n=1 Tax=Owenweeksia hongkongensis TaxID=253245 RepID=UPI003A90DCF2